MKQLSFFVGLLLCYSSGYSQAFKWEAQLAPVGANGFYNIRLSPDLVSKAASPALTDFRIFSKQSEVPYILRKESPVYDSTSFKAFQILENNQNKGKGSVLVFQNNQSKTLEQFSLIFNNTQVQKQMNISGSYDRKLWYVVTQNIGIDPTDVSAIGSGTAMVKTVHVPITDYSYYKIEINDSLSAPLYIRTIGNFNTNVISTKAYSAIPTPHIKEIKGKDQQQSIFQLDFDAFYLIHQLEFEVEEPKLFRREAAIAIANTDIRRNKRGEQINDPYIILTEFTLEPGKLRVALEGADKAKTLYLIVTNADNPPLKIKQATAWQQNYYLTTYLEKDKKYQLKLGSTNLSAPNYDLQYFTDSIKKNLPFISIASLEHTKQQAGNDDEVTPTLFKSNYWIWAALIGIIALLGFFSVRMIKNMQNNKE